MMTAAEARKMGAGVAQIQQPRYGTVRYWVIYWWEGTSTMHRELVTPTTLREAEEIAEALPEKYGHNICVQIRGMC